MKSRHRPLQKASCDPLPVFHLTRSPLRRDGVWKNGVATFGLRPFFFMRKRYTLTLPRGSIELGQRTAVMGILNVTPDSFSDGGHYYDRSKAIDRGKEIEEQRADIIDIGGESSRPGSVAVSEDEEIRRVLPVIEALAPTVKIPISIDTYRASVARLAIQAGAQLVNDISAFRFDAAMPSVVCESRAAAVLMH